ncbi:Protein DGS1, mitochondrial, partial [Mucuna pruriens]
MSLSKSFSPTSPDSTTSSRGIFFGFASPTAFDSVYAPNPGLNATTNQHSKVSLATQSLERWFSWRCHYRKPNRWKREHSFNTFTPITSGIEFMLSIPSSQQNFSPILLSLQINSASGMSPSYITLRFIRNFLAFIKETVKLLHGYTTRGPSIQNLCQSGSGYINERVYVEVDRIGEELVVDPERKPPLMLVKINDLFSTLEASIRHPHAMCQSVSSVDRSYSIPLLFEKLPEINQDGSQTMK